jgi:signal transduction histidine kinase
MKKKLYGPRPIVGAFVTFFIAITIQSILAFYIYQRSKASFEEVSEKGLQGLCRETAEALTWWLDREEALPEGMLNQVLQRVMEANDLEEALVANFQFKPIANARGNKGTLPISMFTLNPRMVVQTYESGTYQEERIEYFENAFRRGYLPVRRGLHFSSSDTPKESGIWGVLFLEKHDPHHPVFQKLSVTLWISFSLATVVSILLGFMTMQLIKRMEGLHKEALRANRLAAVGEVASYIAHEIKNPLGIVLSASEFLRSRVSKQEAEVVEEIKEEVARMNNQIENFLDLSRETPLSILPEEPDSLIKGVARLFKLKAAEKEVAVQVDIVSGIPRILVDRRKFRQILLNILLNALEASRKGGCIFIRAGVSSSEYERHGVTIEVRDEGHGIAPERIGEIMEPFVSSKSTGSGLGLAIAKQLVLRHKGHFALLSKPNEGTRVQLAFPSEEPHPCES